MRDLLPFIVAGVATGSIYGLMGTGLVLTYKTSGLFNFGHGAVAAVAAYTFYWMHVEHGIDWKVSALVGVLVVGTVIGLLMEFISEKLSHQATDMKIVGTVALILVVQAGALILFGDRPRQTPPFLPGATNRIQVLGVNITYELLTITAIALVVVAALYALFRWSRAGIEMRGVVDNPELLMMQGVDPARIRRVAWIIGSNFAALSGVLVAPLLGLDTTVLTFLVVQAFGAAAVGYLSSIPLTFVGGLLLGVLADVSKRYVVDFEWLSGLPASLPFIVLFVVLLVLPRSRLATPSSPRRRAALRYVAPTRVRIAVGAVALIALGLVPVIAEPKLAFFTHGLVTAMFLLSLGLLVRTSGQVSLAHATFAAIGAVAFSQLTVEHGMPWFLALLLASLVTVPVGMLVAIPAIRLSGLYLALATLGFGIMVQWLLYKQWIMFTPFEDGRPMPRPSMAMTEHRLYHLALAILTVMAVAVAVIHRTRLGRLLRAMGESPTAITSMGLSTNVTRLVVFSVSAFLAAIGGILYGTSAVYASSGDPTYTPFYSLLLLAMLALAPFGEPWFALVPAVAAVIPGYWQSSSATDWLNLLFGVFAVMVAMQGSHPQMPAGLRRLLDRWGGRAPGDDLAAQPTAVDVVRARPELDGPGLEVEGLTVRFGGLVAVDDASFQGQMGRITGLIGPNGAGKTTIFNAVSGVNRRYRGTIRLHGEDMSSAPAAARSRAGLGRTFQRLELCDSLTVHDNVSLGLEAGLAGSNALRQVVPRASERRATDAATAEALELTGIADLAAQQAGNLSTGQRRLVELARCIAGPFDVLLLDEPSSGLDGEETAWFGSILRQLVAERGVGVVLVEHDMQLVMEVCDTLYVVEFGKVIASGTPEAVAADVAVQGAYLGTAAPA